MDAMNVHAWVSNIQFKLSFESAYVADTYNMQTYIPCSRGMCSSSHATVYITTLQFVCTNMQVRQTQWMFTHILIIASYTKHSNQSQIWSIAKTTLDQLHKCADKCDMKVNASNPVLHNLLNLRQVFTQEDSKNLLNVYWIYH